MATKKKVVEKKLGLDLSGSRFKSVPEEVINHLAAYVELLEQYDSIIDKNNEDMQKFLQETQNKFEQENKKRENEMAEEKIRNKSAMTEYKAKLQDKVDTLERSCENKDLIIEEKDAEITRLNERDETIDSLMDICQKQEVTIEGQNKTIKGLEELVMTTREVATSYYKFAAAAVTNITAKDGVTAEKLHELHLTQIAAQKAGEAALVNTESTSKKK